MADPASGEKPRRIHPNQISETNSCIPAARRDEAFHSARVSDNNWGSTVNTSDLGEAARKPRTRMIGRMNLARGEATADTAPGGIPVAYSASFANARRPRHSRYAVKKHRLFEIAREIDK